MAVDSTNKSVSRALDILFLLAANRRPMTLTEIGDALKIPKSSTFEIVRTMLKRRFLEQAENKRFNLGLGVFETGSAYLRNIDIVQVAKPHLEELAQRVNDTIFLAMEVDSQIVYLHKVIGGSSIVHTCDLGSRNHMHCTALGKALLAGYSDERVRGIISERPLERLAKKTITTADALFRELERTRRRGYAIDDRENRDDSYCVAAPLFSIQPEPLAAISVATFFFKVDDRYRDQLGREVTDTAREISRKMGCGRESLYP